MAQLLTAHIGSYPRVGDNKDQQRYRRGFSHFERKEISAHAFRDVEQSVTQEIIGEQLSAGLDEITDGLVAWQDPISHACEHIAGIKMTGLARYFNNNIYFRRPVIVSRPSFSKPLAVQEFIFAKQLSNKPVRAVLIGPYTLTCLSKSELKLYMKPASRLALFTEMLANQIYHLEKTGASLIQIDEPSVAQDISALKLIKAAFQKAIKPGTHIKLILSLPFFPLAAHWEELQDFPVQALQLDMTHDFEPLFAAMLKKPGTKEIGLGLLNSQHTGLESIDAITATLRSWSYASSASRCYLTTSTGLEFLPRTFARAKLNLITRIRQQYMQTMSEPSSTANAA